VEFFMRQRTKRWLSGGLLVAMSLGAGACQHGEPRRFLSLGTAPVGGTFPVVGGAIAEVLNLHRGSHNWKVQIKGSKGSQENIRRLASGEFELGMSNSAISYFASLGRSSWQTEGSYEVRAVCTLAPLVAMFVTKRDSGIRAIGDLKGRRVVIGPAGAGFEMFVMPILESHGVAAGALSAIYAPQGVAVEMLSDGAADAAFLGGALPAQSIIQASGSFEVYVVPFDPKVRGQLVRDYAFFKPIPHGLVKSRYPKILHYELEDRIAQMSRAETLGFIRDQGLRVPGAETMELASLRKAVTGARFGWLNVGSMQVVTHKNTDRRLIRNLLEVLWEQRKELARRHPALGFLQLKSVPLPDGQKRLIQGAVLYTGIPFHSGAIEFYESHPEIGFRPNPANRVPKRPRPTGD
jgi:TRAP transporter TAXI family solute receptor